MEFRHHEGGNRRDEVEGRIPADNATKRRRVYVSEHLCQLKQKCAISLCILVVLFAETCIRRIEQLWALNQAAKLD